MTVLFFAGPPGVGKTETAIALAEVLDACEAARAAVGFGERPSAAVGFGERPSAAAAAKPVMVNAGNRALPPELLSRIDEVVLFESLTTETVHSIAITRIHSHVDQLERDGWDLRVSPEAIGSVTRLSTDIRGVTRAVERKLDRCLFDDLISRPRGPFAGSMGHGRSLSWTAARSSARTPRAPMTSRERR